MFSLEVHCSKTVPGTVNHNPKPGISSAQGDRAILSQVAQL